MKKKAKRNLDVETMQIRRPTTSINSLPDELMINIFSYLSAGEVCNTIPKVCTRWSRLHWDRQLYRLPSITDTNNLNRCLRNAELLSSSYFEKKDLSCTVEKFSAILHEAAMNKTELNNLDKQFFKEVIRMLAHLGNVRYSLHKRSYPVSHLLTFCMRLEVVTLIEDRSSRSQYDLDEAKLIALCERVCGTLRVLRVSCGYWTVRGGRAVVKCTHLEELAMDSRFGNCYREPTGGFLNLIASMPSLRHLRIQRFSKKTDKDWISMFSNPSLKGLTSLNLASCNFNDATVLVIGAKMRNLTKLYLKPKNGDSITSKGLSAIIRGCDKMKTLAYQSLERRSIARTVTMIPKYLPELQRLSLIFPNAPVNWKAQLQEQMPRLVLQKGRPC